MKNAILPVIILGVGIILSYAIIVQASSKEDIVFPVAGLGNCKSETECRAFCDKPANAEACLNFAEKHELMPAGEIATARKFLKLGERGPGGCTSKETCESYCNDVSHINECLAFAEKNGLMPPEELREAKQVQAALAKGAKMPGGCRSKNECESFCETPDNMEECITFAEAAGFIPPDELAEAKQALAAIKKGVKPPPCRGKKECDAYCSEPGNFEQCITFAEAAGFVSPEEAKMARKTGGKGPGNCRGREECDSFCQTEGNFEVCLAFAEEHGLMSEEDAKMARKTGGKGPGDCKSKEQCEDFCRDPANQEVCFNFAQEHGLIPEEDLQRMEEGKAKLTEALSQAPPEVVECLNSALGAETVAGLQSGTAMPSPEIGDKMRQCFEQIMRQMIPPEGGGFGPPGEEGQQFGPGGGFNQLPPGVELPPEFQNLSEPPSQEQIQQFMQQQIQQQMPPGTQLPPEFQNLNQPPSQEQIQQFMQQQIQQQMQQQGTPPQGPPPSGSPGGGSLLKAFGKVIKPLLDIFR